MAKKTERRIGYLPQCMSLGSAKVGRNIAFVPYSNEQAAQDHIADHIAKGCKLAHRVATV